MKLFWMFLAVTKAQYDDAGDTNYDVDGTATSYVYDSNYVYDGDGLIGERKRTQAQKDAAKAAKQKAKQQAKYTQPPTTTTPKPTTVYETTEPTTTAAQTTSEATTIDSYSTVTTDGPPLTTDGGNNPYAPGGDTYGQGGNQNQGGNNNSGNYGNNAPDTPTEGGAANLTCFTCNAQTVDECLATGELRACLENEESCELEVRTRYNKETEVYDQVGVITGCKQLLACQNNQKQNFFGTNFQKDKDVTQCRPETDQGYDHSVCRQCCWEDDCVANGGNFWDPQTRWQWGQTNGRYGI